MFYCCALGFLRNRLSPMKKMDTPSNETITPAVRLDAKARRTEGNIHKTHRAAKKERRAGYHLESLFTSKKFRPEFT